MDADPDSSPVTILIVDDEPVNLSMRGHLLRSLYKVRAASSGESALRAAATEPRPDLVLLDVSMPGTEGCSVLERLRADAQTQDVPVILITALALASGEARGLQLGAMDCITKPIKPQVVRARVRTQPEAEPARDWMRAGTPSSRPRWRGAWPKATSRSRSASSRWPTWPRSATPRPATPS